MIWYISIVLLIVYFIWLYFKSSNEFFSQDKEVLKDKKQLLIKVLEDRQVSNIVSVKLLIAFDAFAYYPNVYNFDGVTILADLETIKGLDASAMLHDYQYQLLRNTGFWNYLKGKLKADVYYGKTMRKLGVTWLVAWSRVTALILSTPIWLIFVAFKGKIFKNNPFKHYSENHPNQ